MSAAKVVDWSASEDPSQWNWSQVEHLTAKYGTKWKFVAASCQWQNGLAESRIKIFKQTFRRCVLKLVLWKGIRVY